MALLTLPGLWPARLAALLGQRRAPRSVGAGTGALVDAEPSPIPADPPTPSGPVSGPAPGPGAGIGWTVGEAVGSVWGDGPVGPRRDPAAAWALVRSGRAGGDAAVVAAIGSRADPAAVSRQWSAAAESIDVGRLWDAHRRAGVAVDLLGTEPYPVELAGDRAAPYVVLRSGGSPGLGGPRVAIVGTRRCTPAGREVAAEFGGALAAAGVRVISGLALGIDAAAHEGALAAGGAPPIGVVAGGFDVPYPARHRVLWQRVMRSGVLVSEWPLGTRSEGWRFPARNRIIAALADVVVVVESREAGGSMITAEEAIERDITVLAVPGSIRSPASAGTNKLLRDGVAPACGVEDVLALLAIETAGRPAHDERPPPSATAKAVLGSLGWEPTPTDVVLIRTGLDRATVAVQLAHLEIDGWVTGGGGCWQRLAGAGRPEPGA